MNNNKIDFAARRASAEGRSLKSGCSKNNLSNNSSHHNGKKTYYWATAPYNFIPYDKDHISKAVKRDENLYSGEIECNLENLSPLFVGDVTEQGDSKEKTFFNINGKPIIPATSLKGVFRSYIEIISNSLLSPVSKENIFYRVFNDEKYKEQFKCGTKVGFLKKRGSIYTIVPATVIDKSIREVPDRKDEYYIRSKAEKEDYFCTGVMRDQKLGKDVIRCYKFEQLKNSKEIRIDTGIVHNFLIQQTPYQEKVWKKEKLMLKDKGARVFYTVDENGSVNALGLSKYFRISYSNNVQDLAGKSDYIDFAEGMFGTIRNKGIKGRVQFTAANFLTYGNDSEKHTYILGTPHSSAIRHYLEQDTSRGHYGIEQKAGQLNSYNQDNAILRGHKYYWHRDPQHDDEYKKNVSSIFNNVIKPKSKAIFKIYVDRISAEELGALFTVLSLHPNAALKIGGCKSFGYGSVKVSISPNGLKVMEVHDLYSSITDRLSYEKNRQKFLNIEHIDFFKKKFFDYIKEQVDLPQYENMLKALEIMTDFEHKPSDQSTRNMPLRGQEPNFSKSKAILKKVFDVK